MVVGMKCPGAAGSRGHYGATLLLKQETPAGRHQRQPMGLTKTCVAPGKESMRGSGPGRVLPHEQSYRSAKKLKPMNTSHSFRKLIGLGSLLALSISFIPGVKAGPGIDYFQRMDSVKINKQQAPSVKHTPPMTGVCADAKTVIISKIQRDWANGKGPTHFVQVGTKSVCHSCGTATVSKKNWPNARGPLQSTEVPAEHTCGSCGTESSS
jgi:hypothetical protein